MGREVAFVEIAEVIESGAVVYNWADFGVKRHRANFDIWRAEQRAMESPMLRCFAFVSANERIDTCRRSPAHDAVPQP